MKLKKIGTKIILIVLPVMLLAQGTLTVISAISSSKLMDTQSKEKMEAELKANLKMITKQLDGVERMATTLAQSVAHTYQNTSMDQYEKMLGEMIGQNEIVLGSGLWFEPYVYDKEQEYMGPYVFKNDGSLETTFDYSNAEYDYFSQEYYINAKNSDQAVITAPYYDETSDKIMSSCSVAIRDGEKYLGCVTMDIELTNIQNIVGQANVGENGRGILVDANGAYVGGVDTEQIKNGEKITDGGNAAYIEVANEVMANKNGVTHYKGSDTDYNVYYDTIEKLGWKFMIQIPSYELKRPTYLLINRLILVCIVAIVLALIIIIINVGGISKSIIRVQIFARELADGDFTIDQLRVQGRDELANMSTSLNEMYGSNKNIIESIAAHAVNLNGSSAKMHDSAHQLQEEFTTIAGYMSQVNEAMMNASAATQELNASAEQVEESMVVLARRSEESLGTAKEIQIRADQVGKSSQSSFEKAKVLKDSYQTKLNESIQKAQVVENIGSMANIISNIADEITLLSLNASIEAARAGEQGRGFAVVAGEIGKLAGETATAVSDIQKTIEEVQRAFENLAENAKGLLGFVANTVTPDYHQFVEVAEQYEKDADDISNFSENISKMSEDISQILEEITNAIQNIAESAQDTADFSANIMSSIEDIKDVVEEVSDMSNNQKSISEQLNGVVQKFRLKKEDSRES